MKFILCLTLIVFGACGVFSEDLSTTTKEDLSTGASTFSTTANEVTETTAHTTPPATEATTTTPDTEATTTPTATEATTAPPTNQISNIIDQFKKIAKNFEDVVLNATKGLSNAANDAEKKAKGSGVNNDVLSPVISSMYQVVQDVFNVITKTVFSGISGLSNSNVQQLSDASKKISNLQDCASKNGQSPVNITEPLEKLLQCPVNAFAQASTPVAKAVQVITQIAASITSDITGAIECFAKPTIFFLIPLPNVECFASIGIQSFLRGVSDTSNVFSIGSSIANVFMTIIPNSVDCFNQQWAGIIQTFTKSGVNVAQCLQ